MKIRFFISLGLCLCLALTGCSQVAAPAEEEPTPAITQAPSSPLPQESAAPTEEPAAQETPQGALPASTDSLRPYQFAALAGGQAYWCTGYGVLALQADGTHSLLSDVKGRCPVLLEGSLYVVEDQTDTTEDVPYPVPADAVTGSRILRLSLSGTEEPEEIYTGAYINQLYGRDGRLYFTTTQGEGLTEAGGLFSIDSTGADERLLAEDCIQLHCVQDGYVYFEGIYAENAALCRVSLSGGESEALYSGEGIAYTPLAYGDAVYYINLDIMNPEAENANAIMALQGEESVPLGEEKAQELLGIFDGNLYYLRPAAEEGLPSLCRLPLAGGSPEVLAQDVMEVAALDGDYALYSDEAPLLMAGSLNLLELATGSIAATLAVTDVVEGQG